MILQPKKDKLFDVKKLTNRKATNSINNTCGKESISFIEKELFPDTSPKRETNNLVENMYKI